jgi:hypothetical protein
MDAPFVATLASSSRLSPRLSGGPASAVRDLVSSGALPSNRHSIAFSVTLNKEELDLNLLINQMAI